MSCNKAIIIKKDKEFREIYIKGKSVANRLLVMYYLKNNLDINRVGFSVSKKVGKSVVRNKMKRLIKENFRVYTLDGKIDKGYDLIFICRVAANESDFNGIRKSMFNLFKQAKIL